MLIGLGVGHVAALESKSDPVTCKDCDQGSGYWEAMGTRTGHLRSVGCHILGALFTFSQPDLPSFL